MQPDVVLIKAIADFEPVITDDGRAYAGLYAGQQRRAPRFEPVITDDGRAYAGLYAGQQRRAPRDVAQLLVARGLVEILDVPELVTNERDQVKVRFVVAFEGWTHKRQRWVSSTKSVVEDCIVPSYSIGDEIFVDRIVAADLLGQGIAAPVIKEQAQN